MSDNVACPHDEAAPKIGIPEYLLMRLAAGSFSVAWNCYKFRKDFFFACLSSLRLKSQQILWDMMLIGQCFTELSPLKFVELSLLALHAQGVIFRRKSRCLCCSKAWPLIHRLLLACRKQWLRRITSTCRSHQRRSLICCFQVPPTVRWGIVVDIGHQKLHIKPTSLDHRLALLISIPLLKRTSGPQDTYAKKAYIWSG